MISIILYGRNDNYGYNLHKRAAIGLNCMAELLDDRDDEILFVDYNTPDDFPTFPEAIADTLTEKVRQRLRILRVRPSIHERYRSRTHLKALEPVARNVAVRHSNPSNRWILSTNPDMIFVPRTGTSLSRIASTLGDGYYHIPRFELPESLWEGFNRLDPCGIIRHVEAYGRSMFLNDVTYASAECIKYDAPGDFQLIRRDDLFAIDGFDEEMLVGWHVDSNIARRLHLVYHAVGDASDAVLGYHCEHIRQVTPAHEQKAPANDLHRFFFDVTTPSLPGQRKTWGCRGDSIEEITLSRSVHRVYSAVLSDASVYEEAAPVNIQPAGLDVRPAYDARHVLPFLVDSVASLPRTLSVAWLGGRADTLVTFCRAWERLGFTGSVLVDRWSVLFLPTVLPAPVKMVDSPALVDADLFVFDFGAPSVAAASNPSRHDSELIDTLFEEFIRDSFVRLADAEAHSEPSRPLRRFICIDALGNQYESLVHQRVRAASAPFSVRLRQGYVRAEASGEAPTWKWPLAAMDVPTSHRIDLLPLIEPGDGGMRTDAGLVAPYGRRGYVCRGPFQRLPIGDYCAEFSLTPLSLRTLAGVVRPVILDVVAGADRLAMIEARFLLRKTLRARFSISVASARQAVEVRIFRGQHIDFVVTAAALTRVAPAVAHLTAAHRASRTTSTPPVAAEQALL